jgi:ribonuclease P protein subunit RPR2
MVNIKALMKQKQKSTAKKHILELYSLQKENLLCDEGLSQRYTDLIRDLAMSFRLRLPREIKRSFCKHCYAVFTPKNSRVRLQKGKIVYYCSSCKNFTRIPYYKSKECSKK